MTVNQNDVLEVSARMEFNGTEDIVGVYQFQKTDAVPTADALVVTDILNIMETIYLVLNTGFQLLQLYRDIRIANKTQATVIGTFGWPTLTAGVNTFDATAPGVCALVNFTTPVPKVNPRKYFGVFTEPNMQVDGTWSGGLITLVGSAVAFLVLPIVEVNGNYQYGYDSPKSGLFESAAALVITDVPAYQRRRKQGRGS